MRNILALAKEAINGNEQAILEFNDLLEENDIEKINKIIVYWAYFPFDQYLYRSQLDTIVINSKEFLSAIQAETFKDGINFAGNFTGNLYAALTKNELYFGLYVGFLYVQNNIVYNEKNNTFNILNRYVYRDNCIPCLTTWLYDNIDKNYLKDIHIDQITFLVQKES